MADATDSKTVSRKHPHLISIRSTKNLEDALVDLANSEGVTKHEMLTRLIAFYVEYHDPQKTLDDLLKQMIAGRESAREKLNAVLLESNNDVGIGRGNRSVDATKVA